MENHQDYSPHHSDASRPSLGFPLGTALLLIVIFSLSGVFSCCYHWDKLQSLRRSSSDNYIMDPESNPPAKSKPSYTGQGKFESLPVIMPGDKIAKFIALPCPCEPLRHERIFVEDEKSTKTPAEVSKTDTRNPLN